MGTRKTATVGALKKGQSVTGERKLKVTGFGKRQLDGIKKKREGDPRVYNLRRGDNAQRIALEEE